MNNNYEFWFCVGSQDLYGDEVLKNVGEHARIMADSMNSKGILPYRLTVKPTLVTGEKIYETFKAAENDEKCAGVILWMHTFSPAKSYIKGLKALSKPILHLHTQFNEEIPYDSIDMDFMNENQSAHGDREFAHILTRMNIPRKTVVGFWDDDETVKEIASWQITAVGIAESSRVRICRFADNMNNVAVTEGDKVEAQIKFGWEIDGYNVNDLVSYVDSVTDEEKQSLMDEYLRLYKFDIGDMDKDEFMAHVSVQAAIEIGLERFMKENGYNAVVTHFGTLGGLKQLPGLAIQRLMEKGYGFGAEGDWKTAGMVRIMKMMTMSVKDKKGTSFIEDYTYNLVKGKEGILESHMLEVCPTISDGDISVRVVPLSMGNREAPARLVFLSKKGDAIAVSLIDMGDRFRLIINAVDCKKPEKLMPKLPVATAFWTPKPSFTEGVRQWLVAGGAHHTAFSYDLSVSQMKDWADYMGIETVIIGE